MVTMSQKSSLLQPANSVSQVLIPDTTFGNNLLWYNFGNARNQGPSHNMTVYLIDLGSGNNGHRQLEQMRVSTLGT